MSQNDAGSDVERLADDSADAEVVDPEVIDDDEVDDDDLDDTDPLDDRYDAQDGPTDPDDSDDDDSDDDDDDYDDLEDASDDEIDLVVAIYREDGNPVVVSMPKDLANDFDELITQLRRLPADAGVIGMVSIASEFFVICRVRGRNVQVLLSDAVSANDWPIARDVADFLGVDIPDPDDDSEPAGDLALLADQGISDFDLEGYATDLDEDSDELLGQIAERMRLGSQFRHAVAHPHR
ncbi:MAG TPA: tRNA adenosine deaminase-associated protein [Propionibacteriaceae bacterium]|nr:tRNA adenosine deaminase-associated protein [Propionibacteriaceae bacterium]